MAAARETENMAAVSEAETVVGGAEADTEVAALVVSLEGWKEVAI